ncbi:GHMP family kinase ATP-binding protein, partial [Streptococcus pyogenes]
EEISNKDDHPYDLIFSAMNVAETYLRHIGIKTDGFYDLSVDSQLDDEPSGIKYGLGSSGAVTVATIKAVLAYYEIEAASFLIYQ